MNYGLLFRTLRHLKTTQVFFQVKYRLKKQTYIQICAPEGKKCKFATYPIPKFTCWEGNSFTFLNLEHTFAGWNYTENGMLWAYNQNYFDWINQDGVTAEEGCKWIDKFITELPGNIVGLDPYPIALRCINWIKYFCKYSETETKPRLDSLYSQLKLLEKKLEYHLLGNHLLEDAYALYIGAAFLEDKQLLKKASKLLKAQLKEQVLPDGAHYEQSPMYHCILLDRLLDCVNFTSHTDIIDNTVVFLRKTAENMLGHLESILWSDGSIPLLNDSAHGIAPTSEQLFDYANRLGLTWQRVPMKECGYRKLENDRIEAIIDVGNITATYQPGHTHADTFNYELRIDGIPFVVDTGISTYDKTPRRQYERSTAAHNTVVVDGMDSSRVWGGFRVGKRCKVLIEKDTSSEVVASHNGFAQVCKRRFSVVGDKFIVEDFYDGDAVSFIHLTEDADVNRVMIDGAVKVERYLDSYSTEYNRFKTCQVIKIIFNGKLKYTIQ